jgi:hypothetical protein
MDTASFNMFVGHWKAGSLLKFSFVNFGFGFLQRGILRRELATLHPRAHIAAQYISLRQ